MGEPDRQLASHQTVADELVAWAASPKTLPVFEVHAQLAVVADLAQADETAVQIEATSLTGVWGRGRSESILWMRPETSIHAEPCNLIVWSVLTNSGKAKINTETTQQMLPARFRKARFEQKWVSVPRPRL